MGKHKEVTIEHVVIQGKGNIISDMDGEKVMLSIQNGKYYNLGLVGGDIWELLEDRISVGTLIEKLTAAYEVDPSECREQVLEFLNMLSDEDLISVTEKSDIMG